MSRFAASTLAAVSALALTVCTAPTAAPATAFHAPTVAGGASSTNSRTGGGWCC